MLKEKKAEKEARDRKLRKSETVEPNEIPMHSTMVKKLSAEKGRFGTIELEPNQAGEIPVPKVLAIGMEKKSSILDKFKDTYNKEGNKELKNYVGYLGEGKSQEIIEESPQARNDVAQEAELAALE